MKTTLMMLSMLLTLPAFGQTMYKCPNPIQGLPAVFQQKPCEQGGETVEKKQIKSTGSAMMSESAKSYLADVESQHAEQAKIDDEESKRREALNVERGKVRAAEEQAAAQRATARAIWATGRGR